jgi:hypothetical protein
MMFRAVFWVVLPCKMIVDRLLSFSGKLSPPPNPSPLPDNIDAIPIFNEALSRAKLYPLHILCRYTCLSLLLPPPAHCHWPVPSLSSPTTTDHLVTRRLYKPRSFCRSAYSSLMMEAVRTSETSVDNLLHGSTTQKTALNILKILLALHFSSLYFKLI